MTPVKAISVGVGLFKNMKIKQHKGRKKETSKNGREKSQKIKRRIKSPNLVTLYPYGIAKTSAVNGKLPFDRFLIIVVII